MCGIAGLVGSFIPGLGKRMNDAQRHRGPDANGVFEDADARIMLAHVRLSIIDLSEAASQPMYSSDGRYVLVYNGEVYNYLDLRAELESKGCRFRSRSDTEVILNGLSLNGTEFIGSLNGMFAFSLWDRKERKLVIARDHLGIKPLYYSNIHDSLIFASEIKALFTHPLIRREPDFIAIQEHLARCHSSGIRTAFKDIFRLPPGTMLTWFAETATWTTKCYWAPSFSGNPTPSHPTAVTSLRGTITDAVSRQMVSDVPVGTFLSGGLDSSLITKIAAKTASTNFGCFTMAPSLQDSKLDKLEEDSIYARQLATDESILLRRCELDVDIVKLLSTLIWHLDEPLVDPAIISCFELCRQARENGFKVMLSGQGADEVFGGYARYRAIAAMRASEFCPMPFRRLISRTAVSIPGSMEGNLGVWLRRIKRILAEVHKCENERFMGLASATSDEVVMGLLNPDINRELCGRNSAEYSLDLMLSSGLKGGNQFIFRDTVDYLPNHNLLYTDKMGMAVGLEVRVPLLDKEIIESVMPLPFSWKVSRGTTKKMLRDCARTIIPDSIIDRPKVGFSAPYRKWLRDDLNEMWEDVASDNSLKRRGWFSPKAVKEIRRRTLAGKDDLYMVQWAIMSIELWAREFIDKPGRLSL